ncbi:MAG: MFS transporter [Nitrospiraceae bacterium]|nr:MFS transporter [Nitrospiraceae bacterium]
MPALVPFVLFLSNFLNYLDRQLFSALFPILAPAFRLSDPLVGALGSAFTLSYLVAAPLAGYLSDCVHPRRVLAGGVLVFSAGMWICAMANGTAGLFLGRLLTGIGEAALFVVGPQSMGADRGSGWRLAVFLSAMPLGGASGFVAATHASAATFRHVLMLPVLPGFLLAAILLVIAFPFPEKRASPVHPREFLALFRVDRSLVSIVIVEATNIFVLGGMAVWISLYLTREKHLAMNAASSLTGIALVTGGLVGILLSGLLCDRLSLNNFRGLFLLLQGSQIFSLAGIGVVLASSGKTMLFLGLLLASVGLFGTNVPVLIALLRKSRPLMWGTVLGGVLFVAHLSGDLPSATVIGVAASRFGLSNSLALLLPGPLLIGLFSIWLVLPGREGEKPLDFRPGSDDARTS